MKDTMWIAIGTRLNAQNTVDLSTMVTVIPAGVAYLQRAEFTPTHIRDDATNGLAHLGSNEDDNRSTGGHG